MQGFQKPPYLHFPLFLTHSFERLPIPSSYTAQSLWLLAILLYKRPWRRFPFPFISLRRYISHALIWLNTHTYHNILLLCSTLHLKDHSWINPSNPTCMYTYALCACNQISVCSIHISLAYSQPSHVHPSCTHFHHTLYVGPLHDRSRSATDS